MTEQSNIEPQKPVFRSMTLPAFPDIRLQGASLYEISRVFAINGALDITLENGNRIICTSTVYSESMKATRIYFGGKGNTITLGKLNGVSRLDIACIDNSKIKIGNCQTIRGATVMAAHRSDISIGVDCMISRDVILYASAAHAIYNVKTGDRKFPAPIIINDRVWIGQGVRILAGAKVGRGSVIGSYSVLAGKVPNNCAAAGNPCRVTSRDIFWTTKSVGSNYFDHLKVSEKPLFAAIAMTETD